MADSDARRTRNSIPFIVITFVIGILFRSYNFNNLPILVCCERCFQRLFSFRVFLLPSSVDTRGRDIRSPCRDHNIIQTRKNTMKLRKQLSVIMLLALVLAACSTATPEPIPATETPVPPPTETPLPPTATLEPSPTPDPLLFRDDFESALGEGWSWTSENAQYWSLTNNPGWLEITALPGHIGNGTIKNMLLRTSPDGNFELETILKFQPTGNYQIAGLLIYESASNFTQFGRAYCNAPGCPGDGYYFDLTAGGNFTGENFATEAPAADTVTLRLRREGNTYTAYASEDGTNWQVIGTHTSEMSPMFVGLVSGQAVDSLPKPAQFDNFIVNALP